MACQIHGMTRLAHPGRRAHQPCLSVGSSGYCEPQLACYVAIGVRAGLHHRRSGQKATSSHSERGNSSYLYQNSAKQNREQNRPSASLPEPYPGSVKVVRHTGQWPSRRATASASNCSAAACLKLVVPYYTDHVHVLRAASLLRWLQGSVANRHCTCVIAVPA